MPAIFPLFMGRQFEDCTLIPTRQGAIPSDGDKGMNEGIVKLARKYEKETQEYRLKNWGKWNRSGNNPNLNYVTWGEIFSFYLGSPVIEFIDSNDAQEIEGVITTLDIAGKNGEYPMTQVQMFCLRVEYMERSDKSQRPIEERAKHVRRKFKRPCGKWSYYKHLTNGRNAVFALAKDL